MAAAASGTCTHLDQVQYIAPNWHASSHHAATGPPIVRSVQPGVDWSWCHEDEVMFRLTAG